MICPTCNGAGKIESPTRWQLDLRYLAKQSRPIWGGPMSRGEDILASDPDLRYLVRQGYACAVPDVGFVITPKGRETLKYIK